MYNKLVDLETGDDLDFPICDVAKPGGLSLCINDVAVASCYHCGDFYYTAKLANNSRTVPFNSLLKSLSFGKVTKFSDADCTVQVDMADIKCALFLSDDATTFDIQLFAKFSDGTIVVVFRANNVPLGAFVCTSPPSMDISNAITVSSCADADIFDLGNGGTLHVHLCPMLECAPVPSCARLDISGLAIESCFECDGAWYKAELSANDTPLQFNVAGGITFGTVKKYSNAGCNEADLVSTTPIIGYIAGSENPYDGGTFDVKLSATIDGREWFIYRATGVEISDFNCSTAPASQTVDNEMTDSSCSEPYSLGNGGSVLIKRCHNQSPCFNLCSQNFNTIYAIEGYTPGLFPRITDEGAYWEGVNWNGNIYDNYAGRVIYQPCGEPPVIMGIAGQRGAEFQIGASIQQFPSGDPDDDPDDPNLYNYLLVWQIEQATGKALLIEIARQDAANVNPEEATYGGGTYTIRCYNCDLSVMCTEDVSASWDFRSVDPAYADIDLSAALLLRLGISPASACEGANWHNFQSYDPPLRGRINSISGDIRWTGGDNAFYTLDVDIAIDGSTVTIVGRWWARALPMQCPAGLTWTPLNDNGGAGAGSADVTL